MKPYYYALALFFFTIVSASQSRNNPKLKLTNDTIEELSVLKQSEKQQQEQFINFNKVISFKEKSDCLSVLTGLEDLSQITIFTVYKSKNPLVSADIWKLYGEDSFVSLSTNRANNSDMHLVYKEDLNIEPVLNTYTQIYKPRNATSYQKQPHMLLGNFSNSKETSFKGSIAEIIVYNKVLRGKKKQMVETALALKYGITLTNGKDYLSSKKEKIYNIKDDNNFSHRIAGIGRDDKNSLFQKQSHSTKENSMVTIGLGGIANTNEENNAEINDMTFLIWGDNNLESIIETVNQNSEVSLMKRQWKMQVTGASASTLSTILKFDISTILREKGRTNDYLLVIDPSGDGDFLSEKIKYVDASNSENNSLTFSNIKWDEDGSGSDVFTFALKSELELVLEEVVPLNCETNNDAVLSYKVDGGMPPYYFELIKDDIIVDQWKSTNNKYPKHQIDQLNAGNYALKVTDALKEKIEVNYALNSPQSITVNLGEDRYLNRDGTDVLLDASIVLDEEINYTWTSNNGFTSNSPQIQINQPGLYTITATTKNGCIASDTIKIKDNIIKSFIVFPNQSRDGNYNIQIKLSQNEDIVIKVFDMTGRHLSTIRGKNKSLYSIPGDHISTSGIYNIVLESASQNESRKLIVD